MPRWPKRILRSVIPRSIGPLSFSPAWVLPPSENLPMVRPDMNPLPREPTMTISSAWVVERFSNLKTMGLNPFNTGLRGAMASKSFITGWNFTATAARALIRKPALGERGDGFLQKGDQTERDSGRKNHSDRP